MSRARDKYAILKKDRLCCSYIIKGKDKSIRIGYTEDLVKLTREIKKLTEIVEVHAYKGGTSEQRRLVETHLQTYHLHDEEYDIDPNHAKALMSVLLSSAEYVFNPNLEDKPNKWKTLSSWRMGEAIQGSLHVVPTNQRFAQRYILKQQDDSVIGLYTNRALHSSLQAIREGTQVQIECIKPFIQGIDDSPNQASCFKVTTIRNTIG